MAATATLRQLGGKPSVAGYLRSIWGRRHFAIAIAVSEVRSQHANTALGSLWLVLNPMLQVAIYYLIFGLLLNVTRGVTNLIGFLAVGVFMYHYSSRSIIGGAKSVLKNQGLIRSLQFPRAILPLSTVLAHGLTFLYAACVMLVVALVTDEQPHPVWLLLIPLLLVQTLFNIGAGMILARPVDRMPDMQNVLPFVFRIIFYFSGVLFPAERYISRGPDWMALAFDYNPFYAIMTVGRSLVLDNRVEARLLAVAAVWALVLAVMGFFVFRAGEREYGRG
ncbi:MAG: ABC transporter permease [Egibacteraceae bacterium]